MDDLIETTYCRACALAIRAMHGGDAGAWHRFSTVARAIEAAWPEAVRRARGMEDGPLHADQRVLTARAVERETAG